jgi:hypothetical protein
MQLKLGASLLAVLLVAAAVRTSEGMLLLVPVHNSPIAGRLLTNFPL